MCRSVERKYGDWEVVKLQKVFQFLEVLKNKKKISFVLHRSPFYYLFSSLFLSKSSEFLTLGLQPTIDVIYMNLLIIFFVNSLADKMSHRNFPKSKVMS